MNTVDFGKKLKQLRIQKGVQQVELANALGVSRPGYAKWELGTNANLPPKETIEIMARALGVKPEVLSGSNDFFFDRYTADEVELLKDEESTEYIKLALAQLRHNREAKVAALNAKFKMDMHFGKK